jgi:hypothetical protein
MAPIFTGFRFGFGGGAEVAVPITATGGIITEVDGYRYHQFTSPGNFDISLAPSGSEIEVLVQGGGNNGTPGSGVPGTTGPSGPGGAGGSTGVWQVNNIQIGTYSVSIGGAGSPSGLFVNNPSNPEFISAGGGGGSNTTPWSIATLTLSRTGQSGSPGQPAALGPTIVGGSGGSAGGVPESPTLWWRPFISPGLGGAGGGNSTPGSPGGFYGGGGGGGGGSGFSQFGFGGAGRPGTIVVRYSIN